MLKSLLLGASVLTTTFTSAAITLTPITAALAKPADGNPYRAAYEEAIKYGAMERPSKLKSHTEALKLTSDALKRGDKNEAGKRAAQAVVIYSESHPVHSVTYVADSFATTIGVKTLRELKTFNVIIPFLVSGCDVSECVGDDDEFGSRFDVSGEW